jgi:hypothetical protein
MKIQVKTRFDCTATGTTGHYKSNRVPYKDNNQAAIIDQDSWARSRNQQRNYETLVQLLSLRTQLIDISLPVKQHDVWSFTIVSDRDDVFSDGLAALYLDCDSVPMIVGLDEESGVDPMLHTQDPKVNIWFQEIE